MGDAESVLVAFRDECGKLEGVLRGLGETEYGWASPCPPWTVKGLVAHLVSGAGRPVGMVGGPEPDEVDFDASGYFRPVIFTVDADRARVAEAEEEAEAAEDLAGEFARTWRATHAAVAAQPPGRRVVTRHGDRMLLTEFMRTRVVELVLHGLDLAISLDRPPWTAPSAAAVTAEVLLAGGAERAAELGWDPPVLLAKASGRALLTPEEAEAAHRLGVCWLTLG